MKKLTVVLAMLSILFIGAAHAAVDSIKVSGDITAMAVTRNLELGSDSAETDSEDFIYSQVRLRFDAMLTEGVSGVVQLINERLWGQEGIDTDGSDARSAYDENADTDVQLDLAYIQLQEFFTPELTLIVGRQYLRYGSALIVGDPDTNQGVITGTATQRFNLNKGVPVATAMADQSLRKSFDAVRAVIDLAPFVVDLIYAKIHEGETDFDDDITLFGVNAAYAWDSYNGLTEAYFFGSDNQLLFGGSDDQQKWAEGGYGDEEKSRTYVLGVRSQADISDNLTLMGEYAYQFGNHQTLSSSDPYDKLRAWAAILGAEYRMLDDYNTTFGLKWVWLSGDRDSTDPEEEGWDPMFEDQIPAEIINILFPNTGITYISGSGSFMPREDVTLGLLYTYARLSEKVSDDSSTLYNSVTSYTPRMGPAEGNSYTLESGKKDIGSEVDLFATYDYTEDVQFKLIAALFFPSSAFHADNDESAYSVRGGMTLDF